MQRWDYRVEETDRGLHNGQLRNLGADGWELVSEVVLVDGRGERTVRSVLKRPRD